MRMIEISDSQPEDHTAVLNLVIAAFQEYSAIMAADWEHYRQVIIHTLNALDRVTIIISKVDSVILGSVLLYPAGETISVPGVVQINIEWPLVRLLAVSPKARKHGIGTALMNECIKRTRMSSDRYLALHTLDMMVVAEKLYRKLDFIRFPEIDFFPVKGKDLRVKGYRKSVEPN